MPVAINIGVAAALVLAAALFIVDWLKGASLRRLALCIAGLFATAIFLHLATGFPSASRWQAFGGGWSQELVLGLMAVGVILGIAANYVFFARATFSWRSFLRPIVVSPIVLLPLIGSLQGAQLESVQAVCFVILAFQNGFFWRQVLRDAQQKAR